MAARTATSLRHAAAPAAPVTEAAADRWRDLLLRATVIVLAGLWIYSPTYHGEWLWDDDQLIWQNPVVQSASLQGLAKLWFNPEGADFFPLSYTALWAQWPFFGTKSTGYHVTTILLHILGSLLLWALLARMRIPGAWISGLLFAIHPVCVESVAWVSETKNTLSLPLFLLSCICWVAQDEERDEPGGGGWRDRLYLLSIVFFLLAMLAKTSMVAMPVVLLLHAWWKRGTVTLHDVTKAAPFFAISLALGIITINYQWGRAIGAEKILVGGPASRIATAGMAILFYLRQIVWPLNLLPIYPKWDVDPPQPAQFLAWPVIVAAAWWCWQNRATWGRHAIFALGFFLLMVAPVLGFVTIAYMRITWVADHFIYLPMIGPIACIGAVVAWLYGRVDRPSQPLFVAGGGMILATFSLLAFLYANAWANEDALWTYTLRLNDDAWQAHNRLGARMFARGDVQNAYTHFTKATRLRPDLGETHNNLGTALSAMGKTDEAIQEFFKANECTPNIDAMQLNLASALFNAKRYADACVLFRKLLERTPNSGPLHNNLGNALSALGQTDEAIQEFSKANECAPNIDAMQMNVASALFNAKRFTEACVPFRALVERSPKNAVFHYNLATALYRAGNRDEAIQHFRQALQIQPDLKEAIEGLAVATGEKADPLAGEQPAAPAPPERQPQPSSAPAVPLPGQSTLGPPTFPGPGRLAPAPAR
jgi:Flp pilus assembly protein TadD